MLTELPKRTAVVSEGLALARALASEGIRTKRGRPIDRGYLYTLLNNRAYIGEAVHKGKLEESDRIWSGGPPGPGARPGRAPPHAGVRST